MTKFWKIVAIGSVLLIVLGLGISTVLAQDGPQDTDTPAGTWFPGGSRGGRRGQGGRGMGGFASGSLLDTLAEQLGMTVEEILSELQTGISIAELAENHSVDVETIIDALVSKAREAITQRVNEPWAARAGMRGGFGSGGLVDALAEALDLPADDVATELSTGISVADLAAEHGVEVQDLVDAFLAEREEALAQAVENGRITQEQADSMLEHMAEEIEEHVDEPWSPGGPGRGMRPWGGPSGDCERLDGPGFEGRPFQGPTG